MSNNTTFKHKSKAQISSIIQTLEFGWDLFYRPIPLHCISCNKLIKKNNFIENLTSSKTSIRALFCRRILTISNWPFSLATSRGDQPFCKKKKKKKRKRKETNWRIWKWKKGERSGKRIKIYKVLTQLGRKLCDWFSWLYYVPGT